MYKKYMKNKIKNNLKNACPSLILLVFSFAIFSSASAAPGDCGGNFSGSFIYSGKRANSSDPFTTIVPAGYDFKTHLLITAEGEDDLKAGENVEIVLVMDRSGSMEDKESGVKKIDAAKDSLSIVADTFITSADSENRLALVTYNANVTLDQSLTSNYNKVKDAINSFPSAGQTNISGALMTASNHLKANADNDAQKFIVIATDGNQNVGMPINFGIKSVGSDTTVFSVGIGKDADSTTLKKIAEESGNKEGAYYASNVSDLTAIFTEIIEDILIPFRPSNVQATFYRENADKFSLISAAPNYSSVSNGNIYWNNLGSMLNGVNREFDLIYNQAGGVGTGMPINTGDVLVNYDLFGVTCSEIVPIDIITIENELQCIGAIPNNANMCLGDDTGLSSDSPRKLVEGCSTVDKCEYFCDTDFELKNGKCIIEGKCGSAETDIWCRDAPTVGWCGTGSVLIEGPNPTGNRWVWSCSGMFGGPSTTCRAVRACGEGWREVGL
jgi:uncharacterized protein YegL